MATSVQSDPRNTGGLAWFSAVVLAFALGGCSSSSDGSDQDAGGSGGRTRCTDRLTDCSGNCVDTQTSTSNCGQCDNPCASGQTCVSGRCTGGGTGGSGVGGAPRGTGGNSATGGGTATGGTGTGGVTATGGMGTGGVTATGGMGTGGVSATGGRRGVGGRTGTGGVASGGSAMGGAATGGASAGGASSGGSAAGGAATGGATTGGTGGATECQHFSFFMTSYEAIKRESGSDDGFGGDLGGLEGADERCRTIAEYALPCAGQKVWRAFLSTSAEDAIDRIGDGPWYDFAGRTVALTTDDLLNERPNNCDPEIVDDLPNEYGIPNHDPDGTGEVDNHDALTGSDAQGRYAGAEATCNDWTSVGSGAPRVGHSWPGGPSRHWLSAMDASGCAAGVMLEDRAGTGSCVGCHGGYGGWYCFALTP
jgi:hypothetical protein